MEPMRFTACYAVFILLTPIMGFLVAGGLFIVAVLRSIGVAWSSAILLSAAFSFMEFGLLSVVFDVIVEKEIMGRIAWWFLDF
jgi:hypothetical protein